jgi:hypothetical protein
MLSIYQAYQAYERRANRGEVDELITPRIKVMKPIRLTFSWRLGDLLIRTGMKLKHQTQAGHALTTSTMAEK